MSIQKAHPTKTKSTPNDTQKNTSQCKGKCVCIPISPFCLVLGVPFWSHISKEIMGLEFGGELYYQMKIAHQAKVDEIEFGGGLKISMQ